jgi:hypothetical protein
VAANAASTASPNAASTANPLFYLAAQYDSARTSGFYLDLEASALAQLPVILGVGDGRAWRILSTRPGFARDRDYMVRAIISAERAQLYVNGRLSADSPGEWEPSSGPLQINYRSASGAEGADWLALVRNVSVVVARSGKQVQRRDFTIGLAERPVALQLLDPGDTRPQTADLSIKPRDTVTVDVTMRFGDPDLRRWAPFIDPYGQCRYADWREKVRSDADLHADIAREDAELARMPRSPDYDEYGGYKRAGWGMRPSGFFGVARHRGYWWLITPEGNPCFYLGVCVFPGEMWPSTPVSGREFVFEWLPPRGEPWSDAWSSDHWGIDDGSQWVCFNTCNLIRKYGAKDWRARSTERAIRRIRCWGFSGGGKWGAPPTLTSTPVLSAASTPRLAKHPDVFDPAVRGAFRAELERQMSAGRNDARVLGWSVDNEYNEIITRGEIAGILTKPAVTAAKRALLDYAVATLYRGSLADLAFAWKISAADSAALYALSPAPPAADLEKLRCFYADRYYEYIYRTIKSIDPNHLYLGFWIMPEWWQSEEDWRLIGRHCDVIGYDRYAREYASPLLTRLQAETNKPTLCGEFSFPPYYDGQRGFARYQVSSRDDTDAGDLYYRWIEAAAKDPYCVGQMIFEYRDQPLTGRGPGQGVHLTMGEHFAFGMVTESDRPKWPMVRRVRDANLNAAKWRLEASRQQAQRRKSPAGSAVRPGSG